MKKHTQQQLIAALRRHRRFLITTHVNPDPDAICSQLALAFFLRSQGKQVILINEKKVPQRFHFLPGAQDIASLRKKPKARFDAAVVIDCGDLDRIGSVRRMIGDHHAVINIDHHITNHVFGDVNYINTAASSTAEIVYGILRKSGFAFDRKVALLLYTGILTDTGSFRYENTTAYTHRVVSRLIPYGFSTVELYSRLYESIPLHDLKMFSKVVNTFEPMERGRVICLELHKKIVKEFSKEFDLRDKLFRYLRAIKGVEVIVIFTEMGARRTRVNLRSQGSFDVAPIAFHFNGGGHRRASGCLVDRSMTEARRLVLKEIKKAL